MKEQKPIITTMKKSLNQIHQPSGKHWVGNGFPVQSVFDYRGLGQELSPFLLMDYAGPHEFPPGEEKRGVGAHPHKGFETVTLVYQGQIDHRDSGGGGGGIGPGDVQWMTAGRGIIHEEFHSEHFVREGGRLQMIQLWVNLRARDKGVEPRYQTIKYDAIPHLDMPDSAGVLRLIAGEFGDERGPAATHSPVNLWDLRLHKDKTCEISLPEGHTSALFLLEGVLKFEDGQEAGESDLAVFSRSGTEIGFEATEESLLLIMSGEPFEEPVVGHGPFVMNSQAEIQEAFEEYQMGKMGKLA